MLKFEQYIQDIANTFEQIDPFTFVLNLVITAILAAILAVFYIYFGNAVSNRRRFARNFLPLALTTMVIITIVKSSFTLSLGLVGALSIVRFRSAIKDPEELTFFFFTIGIGVAVGASQQLLALIAFGVILLILLIQALLRDRPFLPTRENMNVNIRTSSKDLTEVTNILKANFPFVELRRVDEADQHMNLSFIVEAQTLAQIEAAKSGLISLDADSTISFIEQRNLAV